mmetsp:Transcript_37822/g.112932  ORF Transcript_37822/g.112932 Transcript_37822/m.112932 type:complete len:228 (-) Transcript_37822:83-766(-)
MEADSEAVRAILEPALPGLDPPILDYLAVAVAEEEGGPLRPLGEELTPFLLDAGAAPNEVAAKALVSRLEAVLRSFLAGRTTGGQAAPASQGPALLDAPICLSDMMDVPRKDPALERGASRGRGGLVRALCRAEEEEHGCSDSRAGMGGGRPAKGLDLSGVPLSFRSAIPARDAAPGPQPNGTLGRLPRKKNPVGMEKPLNADGDLKVQRGGNAGKTALRIAGQWLE